MDFQPYCLTLRDNKKKHQEMAKFSVGSTVRLASGGPKMTVASIIGKDIPGSDPMLMAMLQEQYPATDLFCVCSWFNEQNELKQELFPESMLEAIDK